MYLYMEYSEVRGTWNVFSEEGEWIFEGNYEQCEKMVNTSNAISLEEGYI